MGIWRRTYWAHSRRLRRYVSLDGDCDQQPRVDDTAGNQETEPESFRLINGLIHRAGALLLVGGDRRTTRLGGSARIRGVLDQGAAPALARSQ
jgi:hypothetical protein